MKRFKLREAMVSGIGGTAAGSQGGLARGGYTVPLGGPLVRVFPQPLLKNLLRVSRKMKYRKLRNRTLSEELMGSGAGRPRLPHETQQYKDPFARRSEDENKPVYRPHISFLGRVARMRKLYKPRT